MSYKTVLQFTERHLCCVFVFRFISVCCVTLGRMLSAVRVYASADLLTCRQVGSSPPGHACDFVLNLRCLKYRRHTESPFGRAWMLRGSPTVCKFRRRAVRQLVSRCAENCRKRCTVMDFVMELFSVDGIEFVLFSSWPLVMVLVHRADS